MTNDKIKPLAGVELDALIAEKVMGWKRRNILPKPYNDIWDGSTLPGLSIPHFSSGTRLTDAAGLVVEAMEKKGFKFTFGGRFKDGNFVAAFFDSASNNHHIYEPTPPLAICKAALTALLPKEGK